MTAALLAAIPAVASALWAGPPESICNLPASDDGRELYIRARLITHAHGMVLTDPSCPGRKLHISNGAKVSSFASDVDPDGSRFGIPLGAGTHTDIELRGKLTKETNQFIVDEVSGYDRHDVIDNRWRVESIESGVGASGWLADEQFPFTANTRRLKSAASMAVVNGTLADGEVLGLMKLGDVGAGSLCQFSESAQSMVRMQCMWQGRVTNLRTWVYARYADSWLLVAKTDGVRL